MGTSNGANGLRVALLHNYRDGQQASMRLYADRLGTALIRRGVTLTRIQPPVIVPEAWRTASFLWSKIDTYAGRFVVYPRLVRKLDRDIVHIVDHGQGYLLGHLDARRTVVTCHDVILLALAAGRIGASKIPRIALQVFRISMEFVKQAGLIIADSQQTRQDLVDLVGIAPDKITVIHPGLNQAFTPDPERGQALRRKLGLGSGPLMLHIGRTFYKNIPGVLSVLARLRHSGLDVRLARVGLPLSAEEKALAARLNVVPSIIELGAVSDDDIPALYNAADLLLFPSLYEGFGWPPLEAMASGTPVVCSRAGSLAEVVGDAALTADPEDTEALAWHAGTVLTDGAVRANLVTRGLQRAAQFSWERTADETIASYRSLMARLD